MRHSGLFALAPALSQIIPILEYPTFINYFPMFYAFIVSWNA